MEKNEESQGKRKMREKEEEVEVGEEKKVEGQQTRLNLLVVAEDARSL